MTNDRIRTKNFTVEAIPDKGEIQITSYYDNETIFIEAENLAELIKLLQRLEETTQK